MDREELIDSVTELTSGNRHDYLTRGDVAQIVDATIQALSGAADAGQTGEELEDVPQAPQEGNEQDQGGEDNEQPQPQAS
jgi:hypothetical protein